MAFAFGTYSPKNVYIIVHISYCSTKRIPASLEFKVENSYRQTHSPTTLVGHQSKSGPDPPELQVQKNGTKRALLNK